MALASLVLHTLSLSNLKAHSWGCFGNGSSGAGAMSLKGLVSLDACWYPSIRRWNLDATEVDHRQNEVRPECGPDYSVPRVRPQSWEIVFFSFLALLILLSPLCFLSTRLILSVSSHGSTFSGMGSTQSFPVLLLSPVALAPMPPPRPRFSRHSLNKQWWNRAPSLHVI